MRNITYFFCLLMSFFSEVNLSSLITEKNHYSQFPLYFGIEGGYGTTTWSGLVPDNANKNAALMMSTPIKVSEGGGIYGFFAGYELNPFFALEVNYQHYPEAVISFDKESLFTFENDGLTKFSTYTETTSLMGKLMLIIPTSNIRAYSSCGIAGIHRQDNLINKWHVTPTFGLGFNYNITPRIMGEIAGNYTAGYGQPHLNPSENYIPFLYSVAVRLAYRF